MSTALQFGTTRLLRDDCRMVNAVTGAEESYFLLQGAHYGTSHTNDSWVGGANPLAILRFTTQTAAQTAPDGSANAHLITASTATVYHGVRVSQLYGNGNYQGYPGEQANGMWSFLHFVKAGTITQIEVELQSSTGATVLYQFDLLTGLRISGPDNKVRIAPVGLGNSAQAGWWKIYSVGLTFASSAINPWVSLYMVKNGVGAAGWTGAGTETFYYAGSHVEYGRPVIHQPQYSAPGSFYTPWGTSSGADNLQIVIPDAATESTVFLHWIEIGNALIASAAVGAFNPGICRIGDNQGTANNSVNVTQTSAGFSASLNNGGTTATATVTVALVYGDLVSLRILIGATGTVRLAASVNGGAETLGAVSSAVGLPSTWNQGALYLNRSTPTNYGDMAMRDARFYSRTATLAECLA